jgi:hypothetical protein
VSNATNVDRTIWDEILIKIAAEFPMMWGNSGSYAFGGWPKPLTRHNPRSNIQVLS